MITKEQFQLQAQRLEDTFGERHFPDQRTHMMWDLVRELEYAMVIAIVDGFIRSSKHAPLPFDFSQAINAATKGDEKRRYVLGDIHPLEISKCHDCRDSGFIRLIRKEMFSPWAKWQTGSAACHCHRGKTLRDKLKRRAKDSIDIGPQFHNGWLDSYVVNREPS